MNAILWTLVSLAGVWIVGFPLFVAVMHAKAIMEKGTELTLFWKIHLVPMALFAVILDITFNLTLGSIMFLELPRELLFTSRCRRWKETGDRYPYWRMKLAEWWCKQLNQIDEGHC